VVLVVHVRTGATGSNRGIGLALAEMIAGSRTLPTILLCTSRAGQPSQSVLDAASSSCQVEFAKLDVTNADSVAALVEIVKTRYSGRIDVLINNGGVNADHQAEYTYDVAKFSCDVSACDPLVV
jgi:NAD(P)-dependent dehydrogenase (short-subunit alcohol dehydrogenase family)